MAANTDYDSFPPDEALRRRVDAALGLPAAGQPHDVWDAVQRAVNAVWGTGLTSEWADFFVALVRHTSHAADRLMELAQAARALIDRVKAEPSAALVRELCAEECGGGSPVEIARRFRCWIELPEGRQALAAFAAYDARCRQSRTSAVDVRRALAGLVAGCGDDGRPSRARVVFDTIQTASEFNIPPSELAAEIQTLAAIPPDPSGGAFALDGDLMRHFREEGFSVAHLVSLNVQLCTPPTAGNGALLRAWLPTLLAGGLTEGALPGLLIRGRFLPPGGAGGMSPRAWDNVLQIVRAVRPLKRGDHALEVVFARFRSPEDLEKRVRPVREVVVTWAAGKKPNPASLLVAIQNLGVRQDGHAAVLAVAGLPSQMSANDAARFFMTYRADHVPHAERSAEARRYREKTFDVIRRLHNVSHGFGAMKVVNQRMPDGGPSAFDEFGDDLFDKLFVLNGASNDQFPGYGVLFVGPQMQRIFAHDLEHPSDPLHRYRAAWTDPNRLRSTHLDLDRFADAEFAFSRGFVAVSVPDGDFASRYEVAGVPLTLMIWNDHFPGVEGELAMLVPTGVYRERLRPCLIRCKELGREHPDVADACRAGLDPNALRAECAARKLVYVDLGSPSVAGGGLVNGFPARLPPFHEWEAKLPAHETRDGAGHVHKSHILGGYRTRLRNDPELDAALQPLRDANDLVFDIASSYLNLLDIFFISFATWHRGDTLDAIDFESVYDADDRQQLEETDEEDEPFNPRNARILATAYAAHDQLVEARAPRSAFRVYCSANPLHLHAAPDAAITLDTFDMTLVVPGPNGRREISLARDRVGSRERAEMLWAGHVLAYLRRTGFDLRPYDRAAVAALFPNG